MNSRRISLSVRQYHVLTIIACFFIATIIFTGAAVRVTGSGLGCSTWPKCTSSSFSPHGASSYHAFIEFGNRLFTGALSVSVIVAVAGSLLRSPRSKTLTWLSWSLVAGVIGQIILGGVTVLLDLHPLSVGAHMLLSMILLTCAVILAYVSKFEQTPSLQPLIMYSRHLLVMFLAYIVIVLGIVVTATGPHAGDQRVERLDIPIQTAARIHSLSVWILLAVVVYLIIFQKDRCRTILILLGILLIQGAWGYMQYFLGVPAWMASIHVLFAALLFIIVNIYWLGALSWSNDRR